MSELTLERPSAGALALCYAALGVAALVMLYPFWILIIDSLKTNAEFTVDPLGLPTTFRLENYLHAWQAARLDRLMLNSAIVAAATVTLTLALASAAAYGFSVFRFRGQGLMFVGIVAMITIPIQVYILPLYVITVRLGLIDTYLGLILPYCASSLPLAVLLLRNAFDAVPRELIDAARIDGASQFMAFVRIVLPLSRPALGAVAIFTFVLAWNEFFLALVFIQDPALRTLPLGIQVFIIDEFRSDFPLMFATLALSIGPIVLVYLLLQRQFVAGLTGGAIKA
jgi:raffinose/stachyose/melibiose transport system permease protein